MVLSGRPFVPGQPRPEETIWVGYGIHCSMCGPLKSYAPAGTPRVGREKGHPHHGPIDRLTGASPKRNP